ncbi:MAG TPA: hypothetical protein VJ853_14225 [Thermoanaerobaculia bacterium]|nr:hypothetical protein [Thermoanaerobaculia bacterium]
MTLRPAALALMLLAGCARVQTRDVLPWFRVRTTRGSRTVRFAVKIGSRWKTLPIGGRAAYPIDDDAIFFYVDGRGQIIRRGETNWRAACPSGASATFSREAKAIDCVQPLDSAAGVPAAIRWQRLRIDGQIAADRTLKVESPARVFMPVVKFYDDYGSPYFVTLDEWPYRDPACAITDANGHSVRGPRMRVVNCSSAGIWSDVLQRRLH